MSHERLTATVIRLRANVPSRIRPLVRYGRTTGSGTPPGYDWYDAMMMPRKTSTNPARAAEAPRMAITTSFGSIIRPKNKERPGWPGLSDRAYAPLPNLVSARSAEVGVLALEGEAGESCVVAHVRPVGHHVTVTPVTSSSAIN